MAKQNVENVALMIYNLERKFLKEVERSERRRREIENEIQRLREMYNFWD